MFIDERKPPRWLGKIASASSVAYPALAGCILMMTILMVQAVAPGETAPLPSLPRFHPSALLSDQRLALLVVLAGFMITAGGCFVLSRRSFRDVLNRERQDQR